MGDFVGCPCCHGSGFCRVCGSSGMVRRANLERARCAPTDPEIVKLERVLFHEPMFTEKDMHDGD